MTGFRTFVLLCIACIVIGLCVVYVPACQPPDMGGCIWNSDQVEYECPEETP